MDEPDRWEMTVFLLDAAPEDTCTVDLTPRHCRKFKPAPGRKFTWTNTFLSGGRQPARGTVQADKHGLVTLRQITVTKGKNRIVIRKP